MKRYVSICKTSNWNRQFEQNFYPCGKVQSSPPVYLAGAEQSAQGVKAKVGDTKEFSKVKSHSMYIYQDSNLLAPVVLN